MRVCNVGGRLCVETSAGLVDVEAASQGQFEAAPQSVYERWSEFVEWWNRAGHQTEPYVHPSEGVGYGPPVPSPRQVFAIGLNYRDHAEEAGMTLPEEPMVFTKFPSSVTGPTGAIELPRGPVDYETELVVVIGAAADRVDEHEAWTHVAGLTAGQDLSDRQLQFAGRANPQFSLGKSFRGFTPIGPRLVTPDEFDDVDDIALGCNVNGLRVQDGRTSSMVFSVAELISYLSQVLTLLPGDLLFTGTPAGIGAARDPQLLLGPGDRLVTEIEGIGAMEHTFVGVTDSPMTATTVTTATR